jgi:hypothetical protein
VTTAEVNRVWGRMRTLLPQLEIVMVAPDCAALKKAILANTPSPVHYQKDAQGNVPKRPEAITAADKVIEAFGLGASGDADVEIVPVVQIFQ